MQLSVFLPSSMMEPLGQLFYLSRAQMSTTILKSFFFFIKFPEPLKYCLAVWLSNFTSRKLTPKEMIGDINKMLLHIIWKWRYWKLPKYQIVGYFRQASYCIFIINTILIFYMVVFHHQMHSLGDCLKAQRSHHNL